MDNHIISMVFNLNMKDKPSMYEGETPWLRKRLNMFKKYCIKSFASQTDPDFHLFLFCDKNTPSPFKQELLDLESKYSFITIIWDFIYAISNKNDDNDKATPHDYMSEKVIKHYLKIRSNNSNEIIWSRFESDDIPEVRYNEFVKIAIQSNPTISLGKGLYWDIDTDQFLDSIFPTGPFVSVLSTLDNIISPHEEGHHEMIKNRNGLPVVTEENLWIQLVHGENIWNRLDRMPGQLIDKPSDEYLKMHFAL
tara:strand:+ start:16865 stop:17617 length:753 start_codon:yes stop_codon:yes gene_type:complete